MVGTQCHLFIWIRNAVDKMRQSLGANPGKAPAAPDLSHPSLRLWLEALPGGHSRSAALETRIWWSPVTIEHKGASSLGVEMCSTIVYHWCCKLVGGE
jgi:hypothetical protein